MTYLSNVGGQRAGKTPPRPKPTHLQAARTLVHEDGGSLPLRSCRHSREGGYRWAEGEGLECLVRDIARKNMVAMVPRQRLQNQAASHPHAEVRQSCLQRPVMSELTRSLCALQVRKLVTDRH